MDEPIRVDQWVAQDDRESHPYIFILSVLYKKRAEQHVWCISSFYH